MRRLLSFLLISLLAITPVVQAAHACCLQTTGPATSAQPSNALDSAMTAHCHGSDQQQMMVSEPAPSADSEPRADHQCHHNGACCFGMAAAIAPHSPLIAPQKPAMDALISTPQHYPLIVQRLDRPPTAA